MSAFDNFISDVFFNGLVGAEIGVRDGLHAMQMLDANKIKTLYLIDPFIPYNDSGVRNWTQRDQNSELQKLKKNIRACGRHNHKIKFLKQKSTDAIKTLNNIKLDFVYIDGNHAYESVKEDLKWWDLIRVGGVLGGHDYTEAHGCGGVIKAVDEFVKNKKLKLFTEESRGTVEWAIIKTKP